MDYYKIVKFSRKHHKMKYREGLNTDILDFFPRGSCKSGGLYFSREDILAFLSFGSLISKVTLPEGEVVYEDGSKDLLNGARGSDPYAPKKWKAHRIILGPFQWLTIKRIGKLIDEGANINVENGGPLWDAVKYRRFRLAKLLIEKGAEIQSKHIRGTCLYHKAFLKVLLNALKEMPDSVNKQEVIRRIAHDLHRIILGNQVGVVECILKSGVISVGAFQASGWVDPRSKQMEDVLLKYWGGPDSAFEMRPVRKMDLSERYYCLTWPIRLWLCDRWDTY